MPVLSSGYVTATARWQRLLDHTSPCCSAAPAYWRYLLVTGLFGIGNSTNAVLVLYPQETGTILAVTLFVYAFFHLVAALASAPAGTLADHPGSPKWVVFGCFHNFAIVYVGIALGTNTVLFALVIVGYELYRGRYRAMGKSYAAGLVPPELRASGLGLYTTVVGLTGVMAGGVGG